MITSVRLRSIPSQCARTVDHEIDNNFTSGAAAVQSVWHGRVFARYPQMVLGVAQSCPGTGSPASAAINVPKWTNVYDDAHNGIVLEARWEMDFPYIGPLPNKVLTMTLKLEPLQLRSVRRRR
ncbi:hypothetical protein ACWD11_35025 [Streptomyces sp. NPDC002776]